MTSHLTSELEPAISADKALLYFSASWCGPCKSFKPMLEEFEKAHPEIVVVKIDVDDKRDLALLYAVRAVPTLIVLTNGDETHRSVGTVERSKLESMIA